MVDRGLDPFSDASRGRSTYSVAQLGYHPTYVQRSYPLANTPPQLVYTTLCLLAGSYVGAGDVVRGQINLNPRPTMIPQSYVLNGMPRTAGIVLQQPLTYQPPSNNPLSYMYPGFGA